MSTRGEDKDLTIICVAYRRYAQLPVLIHAILCQTLRNWRLHIIHDGPDQEMEALLRPYGERHPEISYEFTDRRYEDYGHSLRQIGIDNADTEYLLITNDDNYYVPVFLEFMFNEIREHDLDLILCDMVHSDLSVDEGGLKYARGEYSCFRTHPKKGRVDIGCFIVRTEIAKRVGFRDKSFFGDGTFVEDMLAEFGGGLRIGKLNKVLFVHN